jgi:ribosomal protein L37E
MESIEFNMKTHPARNLVVRLRVTCNQADIGTVHAHGMDVICPRCSAYYEPAGTCQSDGISTGKSARMRRLAWIGS